MSTSRQSFRVDQTRLTVEFTSQHSATGEVFLTAFVIRIGIETVSFAPTIIADMRKSLGLLSGVRLEWLTPTGDDVVLVVAHVSAGIIEKILRAQESLGDTSVASVVNMTA